MIDYMNAAFISGQLSTHSAKDNLARHARLGAMLASFEFTAESVVGVYQGTREDAYIVALPDTTDIVRADRLKHLARLFGQESVMFTSIGAASLWFTADSADVPLGPIARYSRSDYAGDRTILPDGSTLRIVEVSNV
jgi:hypothetical protein